MIGINVKLVHILLSGFVSVLLYVCDQILKYRNMNQKENC